MLTFLSPEWLDALAGALAEAEGADAEVALAIEYAIGDVRYRVIAAGGRLRLERPPSADPPDVTISMDRDAAAGLASGRLSPTDAIRFGGVRFHGLPASLALAPAVLTAATPALASLREDTSFDDAG